MKKRVLGIIIAGMVCAAAGYAAEKMITNDDLERKYPSQEPAVNEAYLRQNERLRLEAECEELKQAVAWARKAVHDENDPRPYNDRAVQYYRVRSTYQNKCENP